MPGGIAGTSPCFAMTAFNFSISGGPPACTMAAASLKKSNPYLPDADDFVFHRRFTSLICCFHGTGYEGHLVHGPRDFCNSGSFSTSHGRRAKVAALNMPWVSTAGQMDRCRTIMTPRPKPSTAVIATASIPMRT